MSRKLVKVLVIKDGYMNNGEQFCKKGEYYNVINIMEENKFEIKDRLEYEHIFGYKFAEEYFELIYEDLDRATCNNCAKEIQSLEENNMSNNIPLMHNFNVKFNYGGQFDTEQCKFTLCEKCLLDIMDKFQIKVKFEDSGEFKWHV